MTGVFEEMRRPFLVGKKVYLRLLEGSDIGEEYVGWLNDYEVNGYLETGKFPSTPEAIRKYLERFQDSTTDLIFAIVETDSDHQIGNVTLNGINWINRTADTGLIIGPKESRVKGCAFEAWSLVWFYTTSNDFGFVAQCRWQKSGNSNEQTKRKCLFLDGKNR